MRPASRLLDPVPGVENLPGWHAAVGRKLRVSCVADPRAVERPPEGDGVYSAMRPPFPPETGSAGLSRPGTKVEAWIPAALPLLATLAAAATLRALAVRER